MKWGRVLLGSIWQNGADTSALEREIGELVSLYGLTPDEIALIEADR